MSVEHAIRRAMELPCWQSPVNPRPLEGGLTNVNILVTDQGRDYVVRQGGDIPEHGVLRFNELAISRAAHGAGISPGVHFSADNVLVLDFVDAVAMTPADVQDPETLMQITALLGRAHRDIGKHLRGPVLVFWVFHILSDYAATLRDGGSHHTDKLSQLMHDADQLQKAVGKVDVVLAHNDLVPGNVLRGTDRLWLIDWEYGGFNSPLFDLGGLATNCGLGQEAEHAMLTAYFGTEPDEQVWLSYLALKCASQLREAMWSMVSELTSDIDHDFGAYTAENLTRYHVEFEELKSTGGLG